MGKASTRITKTTINIPIIFMLSVLPDIDFVIEEIFPFLQHRGPTHSIVILSILFIPIFAIYRVKALPYFLALIQHPLLGDSIAGQVQLLWPLSTRFYGIVGDIAGPANVSLEWVSFAFSVVLMVKTKDVAKFFQPHNSNLILAIPTFTVLLPTFLSVPLNVPVWLIPPHLFFIFIFLTSIFIDIRRKL